MRTSNPGRFARSLAFGSLLLGACNDDPPTPEGATAMGAVTTESDDPSTDAGASTVAVVDDGSSTSGTEETSGTAGADESTGTGTLVCETPASLPVPPESLCALQAEVEVYQPGMVAQGELARYDVVLLASEPAPPVKGFNEWTVLVRDVATCTPQPGLMLEVVSTMPTHGHGTPTVPMITDQGDGTYAIGPLNLFMDGYWRVRVEIAAEAGEPEMAAFHLCIE